MTETEYVQQNRQHWMSILAKSKPADLEALVEKLDNPPPFTPIRKPETGLVMVRGRSGGVGNRFNVGEMTVTRCVVRLDSGETGLSYVAGRNKKHAELAALVDAMMQHYEWQQQIAREVVEPLATTISRNREKVLRQRAATRVNFFTMTRTREDKK